MKLHFLVHNKVTEEDFEKRVYQWMSEGDYTPDDIIESVITESNLYYIPLHFIRKMYGGSCSATIGYNRQVFYSEWDYAQKRYVNKTRWVVDWYPHSQQISGETESIIYAGGERFAGLATFVENMGWRKEELIPITTNDPYYPEILRSFAFSIEKAWEKIGYERQFNQAYNQTAAKLPGNTFQNLRYKGGEEGCVFR